MHSNLFVTLPYRIGCLAAVPPTRIEGRLERADPTRHEASSTPYMKSPAERRGRETQKAEAATGRVTRAVRPLVDTTSMCVTAAIARRKGAVERRKDEKALKRA
jgi:hypothetical protein